MGSKSLRIGEVAARVGLNPKTLRFYEASGLLPAPSRGENGYRLYPPETVDLLRFIKAAQGLRLTLGEIKEIITIRRAGRPPCIHVRDLLQVKARELDRKLRDLTALRRRIRQSLSTWGRPSGEKAAVCPHIEVPVSASRRRRSGRM
jgi:DNA-binding transcriptional MerR regulator